MTRTNDSLINLAAGLGAAKDRRATTSFGQLALDRVTLEALYRNDWVAGKVVDLPAEDMMRKWRCLSAESLGEKRLREIEQSEAELGLRDKFDEALRWARLFGGAAIVIGIEGDNPGEPLDIKKIKRGSLAYMHVFDRYDISPGPTNTDPKARNYRFPETYTLSGDTTPIHHTRILKFDGRKLPYRTRLTTQYWGGSYVEHVYEALLHSQGTTAAVAALPYKAVVDIIKVADFCDACAVGGQSVEDLTARFATADAIKSVLNAVVIDKDREEISQQVINFTSLSDIVQRFLYIVAAASDIPATRFLGESAPGLNATGEREIQTYYDMIAAQQESLLRPLLKKFDEIHLRSLFGAMPDDFSFDFEDLWELSATEQATVDLQRAQRDQIYLNTGVLLPSIVVDQLRRDGTYAVIPDDYAEELAEIEEEEKNAPEPVAPVAPVPPGAQLEQQPAEEENPAEEL